jgi:hypothetical protein
VVGVRFCLENPREIVKTGVLTRKQHIGG